LPRGAYRVSWQAQGRSNFIVRLEGSDTTHLVNEILPNPSSGDAFARLGGGHYALDVQAAQATWSITFTPV